MVVAALGKGLDGLAFLVAEVGKFLRKFTIAHGREEKDFAGCYFGVFLASVEQRVWPKSGTRRENSVSEPH